VLHWCNSIVTEVDMSKGNPAIRIPEPLVPVVRLIIDRYNASVKETQNEVASEFLAKLEGNDNG
jgi:hypothetical protein